MKKSKIYVNKIDSKIGNNQQSSSVDDRNEVVDNNLSVEDKLDKLFSTNGYIFNIKVKIITNDRSYDTKIASRVGNSLVTLDNDIINISDIRDIIF